MLLKFWQNPGPEPNVKCPEPGIKVGDFPEKNNVK